MNFIEACKVMKEGKKVKHCSWISSYASLDKLTDEIVITRKLIYTKDQLSSTSILRSNINEFLTDWEIYEEPHQCKCEKCGKVIS